jgi:anthranilate synthase component 1
MVLVSYDELKQYEKEYSFIPVAKEIYADSITPIVLLRKLAKVDKNYYLLESVEGGEKWGRYSFLGYNPLLHVTCKDHLVTMKSGDMENTITKEPMEALRELLGRYKAPSIVGYPSFAGGFVGYFSYEMVGYTEPKLKLDSSEFHDYELMMFHKVIAFDHLRQKIIVIVNYKGCEGELGYQKALVEIDDTIRFIRDTTPMYEEKIKEKPNFTCNVSKEEYCDTVQKVKKYIKEGDIFQAVISRRFEAVYKSSLLNAYRVLRTSNPSPYMYYLHSEHIEITGASPETLVKLYQGKLTTFPVAGTRPRGKTVVEDKELEEGLLVDEKELSEHNMLVDLARNDIGKLSKYGSVKVEDYMSIHRFSKVMHIASTVTGEIRDDKDGCHTIEALLPAGTLSGAPKFRALEIIKELEKVPRGVYGGAIGYLDFSGNLDVCIAIRTAVKKGDKVYVQAGGGIVYDSVPIKEYEESENKASAVIEAIMRASEVE